MNLQTLGMGHASRQSPGFPLQKLPMCNLYQPTPRPRERISLEFQVVASDGDYPAMIGQLQPRLFVRAGGADVGQRGLIPWYSKARKPTRSDGKPTSTNNCRTPWVRGWRCLIPCE